MADLTITAANVLKGSDAKTIMGVAGETITAGQCVKRDPTTRKFMKTDSDGAASIRGVDGIALNGASNGQPLEVQFEGSITIGAAVTVGEIYVASDTAGGIMPEGDLETGDYVTVLGIATTAAIVKLKINESGVAVP